MTLQTRDQTKPMLGGLNTKLPATMLDPQFSPDLLNVIARDGTISKRGGITPLFRDRMRGDCLQSQTYRTTARIGWDGTPGADTPYSIQPGCMVAGHHSLYEGFDSTYDVAFWFRVGTLTSQQGGTGRTNAAGVGTYKNAPYTIKVLPILSKGPIRKSDTLSATWSGGSIWGPNGGMPFCFYLFNSGTGTAPVWSLRLSAHILDSGTGVWNLVTATSSLQVVEGVTYHILGRVSTSGVTIRAAIVHADEVPIYTEDTTSFSGSQLGTNFSGIQVFDCPQQFLEVTATGSASVRPGLGITAANGGYWFGSQRADGTIDQIAVWKDRGGNLSDLDGSTRIAWTGQVGLINLWSMGGDALDYVKEETGRGNHLFMVPRGPLSIPDDGGKEGGTWFYNGLTSYTVLDTNSPNWRSYDAVSPRTGAMYALVRDNMPHGMAVEMWVDSLEANLRQVVAEIHGVLRLEIDSVGRLFGFCRDGGTAASPATLIEIGASYQSGGLQSASTLQVGRRYNVLLFRRDGGTILDLYIDGKLEGTVSGLNPSNYDSGTSTPSAGNSYQPGGITIGMGSFERMIRGASATDPDMADSNSFHLDPSTGFVGRVETFRIVTTPDAAELMRRNGPEDAADWRFSQNRLWSNPVSGNRTRLNAQGGTEPNRDLGRGSLPVLATQTQEGFPVVDVASDTTTSATTYQLSDQTMQTSIANDQFGHSQLSSIGTQFYFTLCYYRFDEQDLFDGYAGAYVEGLEKTYGLGGTGPTVPDYVDHYRATHAIFSAVTDQVGLLGQAIRMCMQWGVPYEETAANAVNMLFDMERQRPYTTRSPRELGLQWRPSQVRAAPGTTPVTMLAEYDAQTESRRIAIAACGRHLYWAKPAWDDDGLLFAGGFRSYALMRTDPSNDINAITTAGTPPADRSTVVFSCWLKPIRMDGIRAIASKRLVDAVAYSTGIDFLINWMVYLDNGSVCVAGVEDSGGFIHWRFCEGTIPAGADDVSQSCSLKNGVWNHLHVTITEHSVIVRVNGEPVRMADCSTLTGALQSQPIGTGATVNPQGQLYLGGVPQGYTTFVLPNVAGTDYPLATETFFGHIADVQARVTIDSTRWPGTEAGFPYPRGTLDPDALYAWRLDEGSGYLLRNWASTTAGYDGDVQIAEFYPIAYGIRQESGRHYNWVAFRDRLMVTNGANKPLQIQFNGLEKKEPFSVYQLGVEPPVLLNVILQDGTTAGTGVVDGTYLIGMTFVTVDGRESDPVILAEYELTGGPYASLTFAVVNLPRSPDPQVVKRRIYCSGLGGGDLLFNRDIEDNDSSTVDLFVYDAVGDVPDFGARLPAPRGRHIAVAGSSVVLGDLPDLPAGHNAIAFSSTSEATFWPLSTQTPLDSFDGRPITGIAHNLGVVSISKGDATYQLNVGAIVTQQQIDAAIRLIQSSEGIGGGTAGVSNRLYGADSKGVNSFDNTNSQYLTDGIEPTWRAEIDHDVDGIYVMHGAYWRQFSQYWLSARLVGDAQKRVLLCFDMATGSWTYHEVPQHVALSVLETATSDPVVAIGSLDGRILHLSTTYISDLCDAAPTAAGDVTQDGSSGLSGSATHLTMAGANFTTVLAGLQSAVVSITYNGGTVEREILYNDGDTIYWSEALPGWTSFTSFVIGAIEAYWTSPWITKGKIGQGQSLKRLAVETLPQQGNLSVDVAAIQVQEQPLRPWPSSSVIESFTVNMLQGFTDRPVLPREEKMGAYHRFRFGTYGINDPFSLIGYTPEIEPSASRDFVGRRS